MIKILNFGKKLIFALFLLVVVDNVYVMGQKDSDMQSQTVCITEILDGLEDRIVGLDSVVHRLGNMSNGDQNDKLLFHRLFCAQLELVKLASEIQLRIDYLWHNGW